MISSSLAEQDSSVPSFKIIILGQSAAGKTKLLTRYRFGTYADAGIVTTMIDYMLVARSAARFGYYDTAGQERYRSILSMYFKGSHAALLVYAVDSPDSLDELAYYHEQLGLHAPNCKLYLVATKSDLPRAVPKERARQMFSEVKHFQTSAKLNEGVSEAFSEIQKDLLLALPKQRASRLGMGIELPPAKPPKGQCCLH